MSIKIGKKILYRRNNKNDQIKYVNKEKTYFLKIDFVHGKCIQKTNRTNLSIISPDIYVEL